MPVILPDKHQDARFLINLGCTVSVTRRTTVRDSVNVVDDFYDIYG
jgi:hypothetical protein